MFTLIILGLAAFLAYRHFAKKKRQADIRNWSVDFRADPAIRPVTKRLPWREL